MDFTVITICGSMHIYDRMMRVAETLSSQGCCVFFPFKIDKEDFLDNSETKNYLRDLHFQKIDMSSEIMVVTVRNYQGDSTREEIAYAERKGKVVRYIDFV